MRRFKEIWKETIKKHLRKWRRFPGLAFKGLENSNLITIQGDILMSTFAVFVYMLYSNSFMVKKW